MTKCNSSNKYKQMFLQHWDKSASSAFSPKTVKTCLLLPEQYIWTIHMNNTYEQYMLYHRMKTRRNGTV